MQCVLSIHKNFLKAGSNLSYIGNTVDSTLERGIIMKLVLEGIEEITSYLTDHYQAREVNIVLMNHGIMINEDVLVLAELLTTLEEVEVVLENYEGISKEAGAADEDFMAAALRIYGINTANKPENDNSPVLALPVDEETVADVRDGVMTIYGKYELMVQIVPLDVVEDQYGDVVRDIADLQEH